MSTAGKGPLVPVGDTLIDPFGRRVKSLRLSVTQRCDLACPHCHHEGQHPSSDEMSPHEIETIVRVAASLGVRKAKITGGEPLLRTDITEIVQRISPHLREVSLTTNGRRLAGLAAPLRSAGLSRVNVSIHTLNPERYRRLCGPGDLREALAGVDSAVSAGLTPVKVNMVVFRDENDDEIKEMMDFCARHRATLQLIEYEGNRDDASSPDFKSRYYPLGGVEADLARVAVSVSVNELHRRRRFLVPADGSRVEVEVVRPMHNTEFCADCTRLRLTSDGRLKPCLLDSRGEVDLLPAIRAGASDDLLRGLFKEAVSHRRPYWS